MEQHDVEIGTRRDLVLYRIETSKNDLKCRGRCPGFYCFLCLISSIYNMIRRSIGIII